MKLGVFSAIYKDFTFEEMIDHAASLGYECVEMACWPRKKSERRYAGGSHIDVTNTDPAYIAYIQDYCAQRNIVISSLGYYPNNMDADPEERAFNIDHLKKVIHMSALLGVNMATTFIGRDQTKTVEANLELFREIWPPIIRYAEQEGVRVGIENCPMLFGPDQWPGGQNLFTTPRLWRQMFEMLPSDYFGLNFDPSHFIWQKMDYIRPLYEFKDKIFHVHFKDLKVYPDLLNEVGIMGYPLDYSTPKLPGLGDIDWGAFVSALNDIQFTGCACVEVEDRTFEDSREHIMDSVALSYRYLRQFVI